MCGDMPVTISGDTILVGAPGEFGHAVYVYELKWQIHRQSQRLGHYTYDSRVVVLGGLDGDGEVDAFVGNNNGYSTVWLNEITSARGGWSDHGYSSL